MVADLADALYEQVVTVGAETPRVRGGNWQTAVVTAIGSDGTLTAAGISGIRRLAHFVDPAIGDTVVVEQNSFGNWVATGRLATSVGEWTALTPAANFSATPGYQAPRYRLVGRTVHLQGHFTKNATLVSGDVFVTLPAAIRPAADHDMVVAGSHGTNGAGIGAFRGILRTTGNFEYRGPSVSTIVSIPPTVYWLT
jgi:hypothetical protein